MIIWLVLVFLQASQGQEWLTPYDPNAPTSPDHLMHVEELQRHHNIHDFGDAEHRGPHWYDHLTSTDTENDNGELSSGSTSASSFSESYSSSESSEASSFETKEMRSATQFHRACTPCPQDMLKKYTNIGIKWICGSYQRARRSFKSVCMMRYRNCEDGTLFVKLHDQKCKNESGHGKHWFYVYKT